MNFYITCSSSICYEERFDVRNFQFHDALVRLGFMMCVSVGNRTRIIESEHRIRTQGAISSGLVVLSSISGRVVIFLMTLTAEGDDRSGVPASEYCWQFFPVAITWHHYIG